MNKSTKTNGLIIALVIFILISLSLTIFLIYDKVMSDDKTCDNVNDTIVNENNSSQDNRVKDDTYQVLYLSPIGGMAIVYNKEVYVNIYDSTGNIDDVYGVDKYQELVKSREEYKEYKFNKLDVSSQYVGDNNEKKWLKLNVSDVKLIANNLYGQDITSANSKYGLIILNADSTVSYIGISDLISGKTNPVSLNISDISDIIIENNDGFTTYLVSSNGTKTDVNTLIK